MYAIRSYYVDYAKVIERIREELAERHFNLIETLGEFVVGMLFEEFSAPWVKLRIAKIGIMKDVRRVGVYIQRGRDGRAIFRITSYNVCYTKLLRRVSTRCPSLSRKALSRSQTIDSSSTISIRLSSFIFSSLV